MENKKTKIIVIGAGFAGIQFVQNIDEDLYGILLIDKVNHHQFQPLYYQVATSQLEPSNISFPLRKIFQNRKNIQIRMAEVLSVQAQNKSIRTNIGEFSYDYLILAMGCKTNYFGNNDLEKFTFGLKTTYDAINIRNAILQSFEDLVTIDEAEKEYLYNIVIVGAGPTGVELSGSYAEIKKNILPKDFPDVDFQKLNIILIEGSMHTLNSMSTLAKTASENYLKELGVIVKTNTIVKSYDGRTIVLNTGEAIKSKNVIWAAGITCNTINGLDLSTRIQNGRLKVDRFNLVDGYADIYALGDLAWMATPKYPNGHPQVANVAINQAKNLAKNFKRQLRKQSLIPYEYKNLGAMATVGKHKAIVDLPFGSFKGYFAWFVWMLLHLMLILSVKNKLFIFINWAITYFTKDTSLRLILTKSEHKNV